MFILYGNNKIIDKFETKKQCKEAQKDYKEIEKAMFGKRNIKFKVVEEI